MKSFPLVIPAKAGIQFFSARTRMDDDLHLQVALRDIRYANVRSGILPPQSVFRRDDDEEMQKHAP